MFSVAMVASSDSCGTTTRHHKERSRPVRYRGLLYATHKTASTASMSYYDCRWFWKLALICIITEHANPLHDVSVINHLCRNLVTMYRWVISELVLYLISPRAHISYSHSLRLYFATWYSLRQYFTTWDCPRLYFVISNRLWNRFTSVTECPI